MKIKSLLCVIACAFGLNSSVQAWGTKEHILLTRLATFRLLEDPTTPEGLKNFLGWAWTDLPDMAACREYFLHADVGAEPKGLTGLSYYSILPDFRANGDKKTLLEPFGQNEFNMHFLDMEYMNTEPANRVFKDDLSSLGDIKSFPRDLKDSRYKESGLLPFALQRAYDKLTESFKAGKLAPDAKNPTDEDNAQRWMGYLSHYTQDNLQPLHSTQDYKCVSYFSDKRKAPNVHGQIEYGMNDVKENPLPELRAEYWDQLVEKIKTAKDPINGDKINDPWLETLMICDYSYKNIPLIGRAAMAAAGQKGEPQKPEGPAGEFDTEKFFRFADPSNPERTVMKMKLEQQSIAVVRTAQLIRRAWDAAHPPAAK